jgi:predicted  nucleic acid-binding Zn-ribbon protein
MKRSTNSVTDDITNQLSKVLEAVKALIDQRNAHIADLRNEIATLEAENEQLEKEIQQILERF